MEVGYEQLLVYQRGYAAAMLVYKATEKMPSEETYGLRSQIRRAATSVPLNIAEGYAKGSGKAELKRFLEMARGSSAETKVLSNMCRDLGYMKTEIAGDFIREYDEIGRMLTSLIKTLV